MSDATTDPAVAAIDQFITEKTIDRDQAGWRERLPAPPQVQCETDRRYLWKIETNKGAITVRLMPEVAPMHVSSTLFLTRLGFYDGLAFHRVIPGFMAQGGCPRGTGTGGPGYQYNGEHDPAVRHDRPGLLSMANAGPGTDGSQFFLTFVPTEWLDGKHTIFGEVIEGQEVLHALEQCGSPNGQTTEAVGIEKAEIVVE